MITVEKMPKLGSIMKEGTIVKWWVKEGEKVEAGTTLYEVETSKLTKEVEATGTGVLRQIIAAEGQTVICHEPVAVIAAPEEDISEAL